MSQRKRLVEKLRTHLLRRGLPRFEMGVILAGTALAGFAASVVFLALGISSMAIRYPLAVLVAYGCFLGLLRLWVEYHRRRLVADPDVSGVMPELIPGRVLTSGSNPASDQAGEFGGAGATRDWSESSGSADLSTLNEGAAHPAGAGVILDIDADEGWVIVLALSVMGAALLAVFYVVYAAPVLMAEVVLDVLLVSGLYRRLRALKPQHWLSTAVRHTWLPVMVTTALVAAAGILFQRIAPHARSIGQVLGGP